MRAFLILLYREDGYDHLNCFLIRASTLKQAAEKFKANWKGDLKKWKVVARGIVYKNDIAEIRPIARLQEKECITTTSTPIQWIP